MPSRTAQRGGPAPADWRALIDSIESRGVIPDLSSRIVGGEEAAFRGVYLDLGEIRDEVRADGAEPAAITICADVLNIPDRFDWPLRRAALVIVARRIQSAGYASLILDYREARAASLTVFAEEVDGRFQAIAATAPDGPQPAAFIFDSAPATGGVKLHLPGREPVETPLHGMRDLPPLAVPVVEQGLRAEFAVAALLRDWSPDAARAMAGWIRSCAQGLPGLAATAAQLDGLMAGDAARAFPRSPRAAAG